MNKVDFFPEVGASDSEKMDINLASIFQHKKCVHFSDFEKSMLQKAYNIVLSMSG